MTDEREGAKKWRAAVADINRQVERVIEIGDSDLAEWVAAAILDCVIDFKAGRMPEASRATAMRLTPHFSRIKANGEFLHNEGTNLPIQGPGDSPLEDRAYSREEIRKLFNENNMPDPVTYKGDQYHFTGKMGVSSKKPRTLAFEYRDYGEGVEQRIWVTVTRQVVPD
jgi:hypothetical protein